MTNKIIEQEDTRTSGKSEVEQLLEGTGVEIPVIDIRPYTWANIVLDSVKALDAHGVYKGNLVYRTFAPERLSRVLSKGTDRDESSSMWEVHGKHPENIIWGDSEEEKLSPREKAKMVVEGKLHEDYMREYVESVKGRGLPVLGNHLYKIAGVSPLEKGKIIDIQARSCAGEISGSQETPYEEPSVFGRIRNYLTRNKLKEKGE